MDLNDVEQNINDENESKDIIITKFTPQTFDKQPHRCSPKVIAKGTAVISLGNIILFFTIGIFFTYLMFRFLQFIGINELYVFLVILIIIFSIFLITMGKFYIASNCNED